MSCGLFQALVTKLFVRKDMKSTPLSSKKSARRQSKTLVTPESPSQNTRLAKKRRLIQNQYYQQQEGLVQGQQPSLVNELQAQQHSPPTQRLDSSLNTMAIPSTFPPMDQFMPQWMAANNQATQPDPPSSYDDDIFSDIFSHSLAPLFMPDESMPVAGVHELYCRPSFAAPSDGDDMVMPDWDAHMDMIMATGTATHQPICVYCFEPTSRSKGVPCRALAAKANLGAFSTLERADSAIAEQSSQAIHFLQLPLEIRRHIYSYVLPAIVGRPYTRNGKSAGYVRGTCDLLGVNKQIHLESKDLLTNNMVVELDVGYARISLNTTQNKGIWNGPNTQQTVRAENDILRVERLRDVVAKGDVVADIMPDAPKVTVLEELRVEAARQVVINVPDVVSLEDWESLEKHQKAVKENGAIALQEPLGRLSDVLLKCQDLQHIQINLRDWDEKVETAYAMLEPMKQLLMDRSALSSCNCSATIPRITLYKVGFLDWPWTNHQLVNEWQQPVRSRDIHKYTLTLKEDGELQATMMERASVAKIKSKDEIERS